LQSPRHTLQWRHRVIATDPYRQQIVGGATGALSDHTISWGNAMLFAQADKPFGGGGANQNLPPGFWIAFFIFILIVVAIGLAIQIMYLLSLSKCFTRIAPRNRRMEPAMVWLNLIPCFSYIWIFFTTTKLADSLRSEFEDRRLQGDGDFGRSLGITYPILTLLGVIPYIGVLFGLAALVCWILYWVKIAGYSRQLAESGGDPSGGRDWEADRSADQHWEGDDFDRQRRPDNL
jgi:hypothetical protein